MNTYRIFYSFFPKCRCVHIRSPSVDIAEHEFYSTFPNRSIIRISQVKPLFRIFCMEKYIYSLEVFQRGSWRPVFYPPSSSKPIQSVHLPFVEERADFISSQYRGDKFRIVKHETYIIKSYDN